jgi:hypothetical protein
MQTLRHFSLIIAVALAASLNAQSSPKAETLIGQRREIQGRLAKCNAAIYPNPDAAGQDAHAQMELVAADIQGLRNKITKLIEDNLVLWSSYESGYYWRKDKSLDIKGKLRSSYDYVEGVVVPVVAPFSRKDLAELQRILDGCQRCLDANQAVEVDYRAWMSANANQTTAKKKTTSVVPGGYPMSIGR